MQVDEGRALFGTGRGYPTTGVLSIEMMGVTGTARSIAIGADQWHLRFGCRLKRTRQERHLTWTSEPEKMVK